MMKIKGVIPFIFIVLFFIPSIFAQSSLEQKNHNLRIMNDTVISPVTAESRIIDSINSLSDQDLTYPLKRNSKGLVDIHNDWTSLLPWITFRDTMFYDPSFLPIVFEGNILPDNLSFLSEDSIKNKKTFHLIDPDSTFIPLLKKKNDIDRLRYSYYSQIENMEKIKYSSSSFNNIPPTQTEDFTKNIVQELITPEQTFELTAPEIEKYMPKRVYWRRNGEHKIEIAQNHISDNWHKGGTSSYYVQSFQKIQMNYARSKITFNNTIEWRLGFQSTSGDTLRDVRINTDNFRTYSVFGYKAYNNWSYSSTLEIITQFFNQYKENEKKRRTSLFSPLDINAGIGMKYDLNKKFKDNLTKKIKLSLNLDPLSMNFRYVMDDKVDETSFGLDKGKKTKIRWGSTINANLTYNFNAFLTWTSRFKYFTDYESVVAESENRLEYALNRYFTTSFFFYARYDENSKKDDKLKYFQFNELLSFGLNYKW